MADEIPYDGSTRLLIGPWVMRLTSDGVTYYPSTTQRDLAGLQVRERQRPNRPFKEIVEAQVAGLSKYMTGIEVRPIEVITTEEGEFGAFTSITGKGKFLNDPVVCVTAVVLGDDWHDRFDGWMSDPTRFESFVVVARDAVEKHRLMLGGLRARRYYYTSPKGWQAVQRDLLVQWYPLDFPKHHSVITVLPAFPGKIMPSPRAEQIIGRRYINFKKHGEGNIEPVRFNGLGGVIRHDKGHFEVDGLKADHLVTVALVDEDKTMTYLLRLETSDEYFEEDRSQLYQMMKSMRPLPGRHSVTTTDSAQMWIE